MKNKVKKYEYLIAFMYDGKDDRGTGRIVITTDCKIKSGKDINELEQHFANKLDLHRVAIINLQLLNIQ